jgi:hypothetical protein
MKIITLTQHNDDDDDDDKKRTYRKQPYWAQHTYFGKY